MQCHPIFPNCLFSDSKPHFEVTWTVFISASMVLGLMLISINIISRKKNHMGLEPLTYNKTIDIFWCYFTDDINAWTMIISFVILFGWFQGTNSMYN